MRRLCLRITGLALMLALIVPALLPGPAALAETGAQWSGEYFNNRDLAGNATFVRLDDVIDFNWTTNSPVPDIIPADAFSVRWTGAQPFANGEYLFTIVADDGVRLFIDDQVVIDAWRDQTATTLTARRAMTEGSHFVRLEYYDAVDQARISLRWEPVGAMAPPGGWEAAYYNNTTLSDPQVGGRLEQTLDYNWGTGSPIPGVVNVDAFSARWYSFPDLQGGTYTFYAWADDGVRVYVDSTLVIDSWTPLTYQRRSGTITVEPGQHTVRVEYFDQADQAHVYVYWMLTGAAVPAAPVPQEPLPAPAPSNVTANINTAVLNVRTGPGIEWGVLTRVRRGETYTVIGRNNAATWWQISGVGFTGWVSGAYIQFNNDNSAVPVTEGSAGSSSGQGQQNTGGVLTATSNASLRVRRGPTLSDARIAVFHFGTTATVIGRTADNAWLQVQLPDGSVGWVSASYVTLSNPAGLGSLPVTG